MLVANMSLLSSLASPKMPRSSVLVLLAVVVVVGARVSNKSEPLLSRKKNFSWSMSLTSMLSRLSMMMSRGRVKPPVARPTMRDSSLPLLYT